MIVVVVGPTGVGKTFISEKLSEHYSAIVINADAVQIYKDLNIGSAKPKAEEKSAEKHYLFDFVNITEDYNAFTYQKDIRKTINKYKDENIIVVGGTGLYIKAAFFNYSFKNNKNVNRETLSDEENELLYDVKFIGLKSDRDELYSAIDLRVDKMIDEGLIEEVKLLYKKNKSSRVLNTAIGYKEIIWYLENKITKEEAIEKIKKHSRNYAKRQYTWFRNKMDVKWFDVSFKNVDKTFEEIISYLEDSSANSK